ncbi:DUF502 domain-containing protein [Flavobacterium sp.]|uniref:DUF502 domain-containing protein n=1 Tax=Flavobacterium sp. TaxID=239 RepID=UPI002BB72332|nr:DUF502 domain-containing protein [Flavobacterium sp.]HSD07948.1 DUF502 domain-containing protein [Flavobacterium sp.]
MNVSLEKIKQNCISGILFLLPVLILLILVKKVFGYFAKFGQGIAKLTGLDQVLGENAANFIGALILFIFVYICGYLVRLAFFQRISESIDAKLKEVIPGYEKHKEIATKTLISEPKEEADLPVLIKFGEYWKPGFLVEEDSENAVVTLAKDAGNEIYIVPFQNVKILKETSLSELKSVVKSSGKGLLACK